MFMIWYLKMINMNIKVCVKVAGGFDEVEMLVQTMANLCKVI